MTQPLFPFQERGHGWLRLLGDLGIGAILADDMGLGKTVQAIAMLTSEREQFGAEAFGPTLVVCPMSVTRQWAREIERFAPSLRVHLHHGGERLTGAELVEVARSSDVVITSYDIATRDIETLSLIRWDRLLLDEAQDVKNPATKRARALRRLDARRTLAMTGTPIENRLDELWAIMDIVNPGLLGSRERFQRSFARPIEANGDTRALERLRAMVQPFILRRPKDSPEVELELPKITVTKEYCKLTLEQASLYQATVDRWMPRIEEHERSFGRRGAVLAMLSQLKQVCNHPEMVLATGRPLAGRSGKLERLVELLEAMPADDKALVFTQYPGFDRLVPHLHRRLGREIGFFHGGLAARQRDELVEAFSHPDGPVGPRDLDSRRRARPQPARREPRLPLRPLVEPRRRAAGDRPRLPVRPAQGRLRPQPHLHGDARGADRRAPRLEARAGREGRRRPRRRLARRARPRRDPRRRLALGRLGRGGGMTLVNEGRPIFVDRRRRPHRPRAVGALGRDLRRPGRGLAARRARPDPRAHRARPQRPDRPGRDLGARDRLERRRVRASAWRPHRCRPASGRR